MTFKMPVTALLLIAFAQAGFAEDHNQWSAVQALRQGDRVGIIQANMKRVEGRFESATDSRITLRADRDITLEKAEVVRVYRSARHGRLFGTVLGGVIGVAAGGVVDGTLGQYLRNESNGPDRGVITAIGAATGAGLGAVATGWSRTVYQRSK